MATQTNNIHDELIKILLIEDDEDDFILTRDLLQEIDRKRLHLDWANSFLKGIQKIKNSPYDLCLVDYRLGVKTGVEFIREVKKYNPTLPFIMLTGEHDRDTDIQAMKVGAYDYLMKGTLDPVSLERTIRYTLERKRTEEKLRKAEARYRTYFENAIEGIFQTSPDGKLLAANPALAQIVGYDSPEDLIRNFPSHLDQIYVKPGRRRRLLSLATKKGYTNNFESEIFKKDGSVIWISENVRTIYDESGDPSYFEGTAQDITVRKIAEQEREKLIREQIARKEAEAAQRRLQYLADASKVLSSSLINKKTLQHLTDIIIPAFADWCTVDTITDGKLTSLIICHKDEKLLKLGQKLKDIYPASPKSSVGIYEAIRTKKPILYPHLTEAQLKKVTYNESHFTLLKKMGISSVLIVPMVSHSDVLGAISFVRGKDSIPFTKEDMLFAQELASRAASAMENANLYEQAQEGIRVRDEFLNIASHELKTPLTSLQLQMQIILKMLNDDNKELSHHQLDKLLHSSTKQIQRLAQLINDLLDVSRISNKKLDLNYEKGNVNEVIERTIERFKEPIENSGSTVISKTEKNIKGTFDISRFDQVVTNLLSNAIKYGQGKPITVTLKKDHNKAILTVQDKGLGMTQSEAEKIFDKFERTESAKKYGGVGLGLYIVNQIVQTHGGTVRVESQKGKGSTFTVVLPLQPSTH